MRKTLYSPPDGEGPSVVATCIGCKHVKVTTVGSMYCNHKDTYGGMLNEYPVSTPSWCPIVAADPEGWEKRLRGQ